MQLSVELSEQDIRTAVKEYIERHYGINEPIEEASLYIEVKSKQNYKSEWELASYRGKFVAGK